MSKPVHVERLSATSWSARVTHPITGKRERITLSSPERVRLRVEEVRRIADDLKSNLISIQEAERELSLKIHGAPMVDEIWRAYTPTLRGEHKTKTEGIWKTRLEPYFGKARVYELTPDVMARWERSELQKGISNKTLCNAFWALRAAVRAQVPHRVSEVPWRAWKPKPRARGEEHLLREGVRTIDELRQLLAACKAYDEDVVRWRGFSDMGARVLVLHLCGLRQSEAAALGWDHVTLDGPDPEARIWFASKPNWQKEHPTWERPKDPPKGNKRRGVHLHPAVVQTLRGQKELLERVGWYRPDGPVFPAPGGQWRKTSAVLDPRKFRLVAKLAGLEGADAIVPGTQRMHRWTTHSTRHGFGTMSARGIMMTTGDIEQLRQLGGWSKLETAESYIKRASRARPQTVIPELPMGELPMLALPAHVEERHRARLKENETKLLEVSSGVGVVVRDKASEEKGMTLAELAERYPDTVPPAVTDRARARYRSAYLRAERAGKPRPVAQAEGKKAQDGLVAAFRGLQRKRAKG